MPGFEDSYPAFQDIRTDEVNMGSKNLHPDAATRCARFSGGRIYFSRETERRFFFAVTVVMTALGLAVRFGLLQ